jgi:hypothetical protein
MVAWDKLGKKDQSRYMIAVGNLYGNHQSVVPPKTPRKKRNNIEEQNQIKFSTWLKEKGIWHTASANGGSRNPIEGAKLKRMGVSAGYPDITIPYVTKLYPGLYIEFKRDKKAPISEYQLAWLDFLTRQGYYATVCYSFEEAVEVFNFYFS